MSSRNVQSAASWASSLGSFFEGGPGSYKVVGGGLGWGVGCGCGCVGVGVGGGGGGGGGAAVQSQCLHLHEARPWAWGVIEVQPPSLPSEKWQHPAAGPHPLGTRLGLCVEGDIQVQVLQDGCKAKRREGFDH